MGTIRPITKIYEEYVNDLKSIHTDNQSTFEHQVNEYRAKFLSKINSLRDEYPESIYINYQQNISLNRANQIIQAIVDSANYNYTFPILPSDQVLTDHILKDTLVLPSFMSLASENSLVTDKDGLNDWIMTLLLSMPVKSVKLTIVDTNCCMWTDFIYANLSKEVYGGNPIIHEREYANLLERLNEKMISTIQKYGDVTNYNETNHCIAQPYEVVILVSEPDDRDSYRSLKNSLFQNGSRGGIYMVRVIDYNDKSFETNQIKELRGNLAEVEKQIEYISSRIKEYNSPSLYQLESYRKKLAECNEKQRTYCSQIEQYDSKFACHFFAAHNNCLIQPTPVYRIPNLLKAALDYLNTGIKAETKQATFKIDINKEITSEYKNPDEIISVPVGKDANEDAAFKLDQVSHVHAFVVGQSGSGKSVFLHNVISGIMLNYSPSAVELYLMDFKLGGVEFNRYNNEKHVHALIVDNSDSLITLEILRELKNRMAERGKLFQRLGVTNIKDYNLSGETKMPHIVLVADECHELFMPRASVSYNVTREISEILTMIAKEGRNQGVHLLMATQTLSGTDISTEILANISDFYLLKCSPVDAEKLVPNSSSITSTLSTGNVFYSGPNCTTATFRTFYTDKSEVCDIIAAINEKSSSYKSNFKFIFNGSSIFQMPSDSEIEENYSRICRKYPVAFIGKSIDLNQEDVRISLKEDISENIVIVGLNDEEQSTRVVVNFIQSLSHTSNMLCEKPQMYLIDCLQNDEGKYSDIIDDCIDNGIITMVRPRNRASFLKQMAEDINRGRAEDSIIFILGQDKFRELKMDMELDPSEEQISSLGLSAFTISSERNNQIRTFSDAINTILDKGPEVGVHTIIELEKISNFLFCDYVNPREVYRKFKHVVLLRSDAATSSLLRLDDQIKLEQLNKDEDRLRAYYYSEEKDSYTLFTPYMPN